MQTLFVCGSPRSGTSIVTELLTSHPDIALGMERFKFLYPKRQLAKEYFEEDHFFEFPSAETNISDSVPQYRKYYQRLKAKYRSASIKGDKYPHLYRWIPDVASAFPGSCFVFVLRDIGEVASSWNRRAERATDRWPRENDYRAAVHDWNDGLVHALSAFEQGYRIKVIRYERIFRAHRDDAIAELGRALAMLGLSPSRELELEVTKARDKHEKLQLKRKGLTGSELDYVIASADWEAYKRLKKQEKLVEVR